MWREGGGGGGAGGGRDFADQSTSILVDLVKKMRDLEC